VRRQLILANIYLGLAEGALGEARNYTLAQTRPWITSGVASPSEDPYILTNYGNMYVELQAAKGLADRAVDTLQRAWEVGESISANCRGRVALDIAAAKTITTRAALDVTNRMFEVMGSRATTGSARLDRFWRNVRTHTLHEGCVIRTAYEYCHRNQLETARLLGVSRNIVRARLLQCGELTGKRRKRD
jgi:alkylation response protein AidB-like acyl-CoA dehydrogenase